MKTMMLIANSIVMNMTHISRAIIFLSTFLLLVTQAKADAVDIGEFTLGVFSSIAIHELGHATAVTAAGGHVSKIELYQNGLLSGATYYDRPAQTKGENKLIAVSGLLTTSLATEVIIQNQSLHDKSFAQGMLAMNLLSNASYVYNFYTKRFGVDGWRGNDIDVYESYGGNANAFNLLLVAHTIYSIYRIDHETDIVPFAKRNLFGVSFKF